MEIICAKVIARVVDSKFKQLCCGCKEYEQDCLMLEEFEKWRMYGPDAMEETKHGIWLEVRNVLKILNVPFEKHLIDHLSHLQKSPDLMLSHLQKSPDLMLIVLASIRRQPIPSKSPM